MARSVLKSSLGIALIGLIFTAYAATYFVDGLTIAKTQQQLSKEIERHPSHFLQLAADPLYRPLFTSYDRELNILRKLVVGSGPPEINNRQKANPLFKEVINAKDDAARRDAARNSFLKLARPTIDEKTIYVYKLGKEISLSMGIELPELRPS